MELLVVSKKGGLEMHTSVVSVNIFQDGIDLHQIKGYEESVHGRVFSNFDEIHVNKVMNGYAVLYTDKMFEQLDPELFGENLIEILEVNIQNMHIDVAIEIQIMYYPLNTFAEECASNIIQLDYYLDKHQTRYIKYSESDSVRFVSDYYDEDDETFHFDDIDDEDENTSEEDEDDDYQEDLGDVELNEILNHIRNTSDKKSVGKNKKKTSDSSKILKNAKNPKKTVRRHGIIVYNDKDSMKRDRRIIKNMIKDFIPGKSQWAKEFRSDILSRWMASYCISKKNLKRAIKSHKNSGKSKSSSGGKIMRNTADFTRRLFGGYGNDSRWDDPSR
jgi:hypothetical protein